MEAIGQAGAAVGIRTQNGITLAAERKILSKVFFHFFHKENAYIVSSAFRE